MPGSRLLPAEQRTALPAPPTTSRWWRTHVLVRSWSNRHRRHWLAPLLVCAPPVGVAMVWAGATRPGHRRRWLTAGAAVWTLVLLLTAVVLTVPGASPADADASPPAVAGGPAPIAPAPTSAPTRDPVAAAAAADDAAAAAAAVRAAATNTAAGVAAAGVETPGQESGQDSDAGVTHGADPSAGGDSPPASGPGVPAAASPGSASGPPPAAAQPPRATPTQTPRRPLPQPGGPPPKPSIPTANPFTPCAVEGGHALSPNGFPLRCYRTPIGLYWIWGQ